MSILRPFLIPMLVGLCSSHFYFILICEDIDYKFSSYYFLWYLYDFIKLVLCSFFAKFALEANQCINKLAKKKNRAIKYIHIRHFVVYLAMRAHGRCHPMITLPQYIKHGIWSLECMLMIKRKKLIKCWV